MPSSAVARAIALLPLLSACGSDTFVDVVVHAEPTMAARVGRLEMSADGRRPERSWEPREGGDALVLQGGELSWPVRYRFRARREVEGREYRVTARAYDVAGNNLTLVRVIGRYREGETLRHVLRLDDACLFRVCFGNEETCQAGRCRDARDVSWDLDASTEPPPSMRPDAGADASSDAAPSDASSDASSDAAPSDA